MPVRPGTHTPHAPTTAKHKPPEMRQTSTERGYGYRWQQARAGYLRKHPLCVHCQREGRVEPATELDHITPHRGDKDLFWSRSNWQGLCRMHHSRKTAAEDGGFGNARRS
ncbi:HNH endonuclease signature motif containing protein [Pseudomonas plecoglossicida]|uniref:HNH endonuclease signature motif containing protein n=1 Tax=Pseudomonas putida group TaxID=136845 RepID=UPI00240FC1BC|nr:MULTISPECIES: HNH endonuclease signature motif containing protein [Pseudomonas putida group]MDQ7965651.1 HNH endonuclease signature motif containing protein [Pseudomonas plecoglossicida]WFG04487.1 HNH endonuclease signature motif containing protein [Pseudomonas putida]